MRFSALEIKGIRNLSPVRIEPCEGVNILVGANASGKTSFLEALGILSSSRSFRTRQIGQAVQKGSGGFLIVAEQTDPDKVVIGIEKNGNHTRFRYDGNEIRTSSEQIRKVPIVLITPDHHELISGPPRVRRRWMDLGVFHVKPSYLDQWKQYNLALRNRNRLLRRRDSSDLELSAWEGTLEESARAVTELRQEFVDLLGDQLTEVSGYMEICKDVGLSLLPGWDADKEFIDVLREGRDRDRYQGYTVCGPHCADILFSAHGHPAREFFSRGQQKILLLSLAVALSLCLPDGEQGKPVIMVDDLSAELDKCNLAKFMTLLSRSGCQVFITCTDPKPLLHAMSPVGEKAWFHVKQGVISPVRSHEVIKY